MFKKIATTVALTIGLASAQSWTDYTGYCPDFYGDKPSDFQAQANQYFPKKDEMTLNDPSLHEMYFEYDPTPKSKRDKTPKDASIKCMYFKTQGDEETSKISPRYCLDDDAKEKADKGALATVPNTTIPLWNVKKITSRVVDRKGIVDMTFHMRYTNFSDPTGYYTQDRVNAILTSEEVQAKINSGELPDGNAEDFDLRELFIIAAAGPQFLKWDQEL